MANRQSALHHAMHTGSFGNTPASVTLSLDSDLRLIQVAAWTDTVDEVLAQIKNSLACDELNYGNHASGTATCAALQVEPLKWWLLGTDIKPIAAEVGSTLDLSHSRTRLRIAGTNAENVLNRFLPIDLRDHQFPINSVANSAIHHVGVTLWRSDEAFELFIPRGYAEAIYEMLFETALQFGVIVK